jgi:hypothetical protein
MSPLSYLKAGIAAGVATLALAVAGGSVAAFATTGSPNPGVWGKTVTAAVANCKAQLRDSQRGIGQCVSDVAQRNGVQERAEPSKASEARENKPGGKDVSQRNHKPDRGPEVTPGSESSHPTGRPTSLPARR